MKKIINGLLAQTGYHLRALHVPLQSFENGVMALAQVISIDVVIDIGVALGTPGLYRAFPNKSLLLIEANPRFKTSVEQISHQLHAKAEMVFCGAKEGQIELWDANQSSSMYMKGRVATNKTLVPMETLDVLVERNGMHGKSLIKIDVEGAEMEVLKGASHALLEAQALIIEVSWGRGDQEGVYYLDVLNFMEQRGFTLFNIIEGGGILEHNRLFHADFVFLKER